jgi:hypothetical protein
MLKTALMVVILLQNCPYVYFFQEMITFHYECYGQVVSIPASYLGGVPNF